MPRPGFPKTVFEFQKQFSTEEDCLEFLIRSRWPEGFICPRCGHDEYFWIGTRKLFRCKKCDYEASPTAGTVMHRSKMPLTKWFQAAYLATTHTPGISALQFQRQVGLSSYQTAFMTLHKLRAATVRPDRSKLSGIVEVDETYIGGRKPGKRGRGAEGKTKVVGAAQRNGKVVAQVVPDVKRHTIVPFMVRKVDSNATLFTDEFPTYDTITRIGYKHKRIAHHSKVYVNGNIHTNNIEGFWSLVKRGITGVYHSVSPLYLQSYINEYSFRYNHRKAETPMFKLILNRIS